MSNPVLDKVSPVSFIGYCLNEINYEVNYIAPSHDIGYDQLLIFLKRDYKGREVPVKVAFAEDIAAFYASKAGRNIDIGYGFNLEFILMLAIEQPQYRVKPDLARLLNVLNQRNPLGAYGINKGEGIFLKYTLPVPDKDVKLELVADILDTLGVIARANMKHFDAYYSGKYPVEQIIANIEKK